jgi:hypothetical protein
MHRFTILTAILTVVAAIAVAGPASADTKQTTTTTSKKDCVVIKDGKGTVSVPDGTVITETTPQGDTSKWKCSDGQWVLQMSLRPQRIRNLVVE